MPAETLLNHDDLVALVESARDIGSEIDWAELLQKILFRATSLTCSESASVILADDERGGLYFAAASGPRAATALAMYGEAGPKRVSDDENESKAGKVYKTGETLVVQKIRDDADHFQGVDKDADYETRSLVCVPLALGKRRIGVVQLVNKEQGAFTPRDVALLEHFAAHAASAIRNAQLVRELLAHKGLFVSSARRQKTDDLLRELSEPAHIERLTVLFADMRGFTRLAQSMGEPVEIERHLNEFLSLLAGEVMRHEGMVNKFLGDGVMAIFRGVDEPEKRAARCAFGIVDGFAELRTRWNKTRPEKLTYLDVGVGIATGNAMIGCIGSGPVKDYTAIGGAVNLAAAFERAARNGLRVLVDQSTFSAIEPIIADAEEVQQDEDKGGIVYKCFHLRCLQPPPGEIVVRTAGARGSIASPGDIGSYYKDSWAIVVGVDTYKSVDIPRLNYAVADARAVADALPGLGFSRERTELIVNERASAEAVRQAIYGKVRSTGREDRLFVFFALHGQVMKLPRSEEGYLLPWDADPANLPLTAIPMAELAQIGRRLPPKHVLFVLDSCFSGYAARRDVPDASASVDLSVLTAEPVVQLLTAGTSDQRAVEEGGHGIFTQHLLKGLEGWADHDHTGLTALKLAVFVQQRVLAQSQNRQTPQYAKLDGEGEFLFRPPQG